MEALLASDWPGLQRPGGMPPPAGSAVPPLSLATSALALGGAALLDASGSGSSNLSQPRAPAYPAQLAPGGNLLPAHAAGPYSYSAGPALRQLPAAGVWPGSVGAALGAWQPQSDRLGPQQRLQPPPPLDGAGSSPRAEPGGSLAPLHPGQAEATATGLVPLHLGPQIELGSLARAAADAAAGSAGSREAAPTGGSAAPPDAARQDETQQAGWPHFLL